MKPLSHKKKEFLYGACVFGRLRWIAKPIYDALLGMELIWHRIEDLWHPRDKVDVSSVTAIIKTFERPYAVKRLVKSIKRIYPELTIIVVDDSETPVHIEGVKLIRMPFNTGISVGRNQALNETDTPYFLLLDDDFVFSHRQNLGEMIRYMEEYPQVDILGGRYIDLPLYICHDFHDMPIGQGADQPIVKPGTDLGGKTVANKVQNYFIARTESVKNVRWKPELKTLEHTEFFTRASGKLVTAFDSEMLILHAKTPFDIAYLKFRFPSMNRQSPKVK